MRPLETQLAFFKTWVSAADRITLAIFPIIRRSLPFALLLAICAIAVLSYFRTPWYDEVFFLDTGVELARGNGFQNHSDSRILDLTPFPLNYPLFMLSMNTLIHFWGLNFYVIRGACFLLTIGACFIFMGALRRAGFFASKTVFQCSLFFLLLTGGVLTSGTHVRPEGMTLLVFSLLLRSLLPKRYPYSPAPCKLSLPHLGVISFFAALVPWCALNMLHPVVIGVAVSWLLFRYDFRKVIAVGFGLCMGLASVFLFYYGTHSLEAYKAVAELVGGTSPLQNFISRVKELMSGNWEPAFPRHQISWVAITSWLIVLLGLLGPKPFAISGALRKYAWATLLFSIGTFLVFCLFFHIWMRYSIFFFPPMCVILVAWLQQLFSSKHPALAVVGVFGLVVSLSIPFAVIKPEVNLTTLIPEYWLDQPHPQLSAFMQDLITPEDAVMSHYSVYFAVRPVAKDWYPLDTAFVLDNERIKTLTKLCISENVRTEIWWFRLPWHWRDTFVHLNIPYVLYDLGKQWNCTFTEITHQSANAKNAPDYRVFSIEHLQPDVSPSLISSAVN